MLMSLMCEAARAIGATVRDAIPQLSGSRFNAEVLSEAIAGETLGRRETELPNKVGAVMLDDIPVLVGVIDGTAVKANVDPQVRRYRNQATIARSWLGTDAPNLQLFLTGPIGALRDPAWRQLAAEIEADDRTCRKLVWLYQDPPTIDDAMGFFGRTFIARPWPIHQLTEQLDSMANIELPDGWEEAINDPDLDFNGLVEKLVELERGERA
ncbi:ABC-three component system middle component 1 [Sinorhizobium fredii]|uniref:Uncharacterized protein n=1 Tax=Rhizobium fredii TaxID=380 RepID=A0A2L0HA10_RHIFR|nr:ABC-three component system middle component 1 [Sinorhizobium fredii]AUX78315.1 hypothetical protein NXT3_PA00019 [Sinorhizobium fredii]